MILSAPHLKKISNWYKYTVETIKLWRGVVNKQDALKCILLKNVIKTVSPLF